MSLKRNFKSLLTKLSQDPTLKSAMDQIRSQAAKGGKSEGHFEALPKGLLAIVLFAGRYAGKKRMKAIAELIDVAVFLISLSLLIKQNIFDRPEVQDFFRKTWKDVSTTASQIAYLVRVYVDRRLALLRKRSAA